MKLYDVLLNGSVVGHVRETYEGLYSRYQCNCLLPDTQIYRLRMHCGEKEMDLGICVPEGKQYVTNKKIQNKQITDGDKVFQLVPDKKSNHIRVIPVLPNTTFGEISKLEYAHLYHKNGEYRIVLDC